MQKVGIFKEKQVFNVNVLQNHSRIFWFLTLNHCMILQFVIVCISIEAVAAGSPYRYPLWLARALNSAIYDVKWDYEGNRAIAKIADFYVKIAVFYNKFMLLCPIL